MTEGIDQAKKKSSKNKIEQIKKLVEQLGQTTPFHSQINQLNQKISASKNLHQFVQLNNAIDRLAEEVQTAINSKSSMNTPKPGTDTLPGYLNPNSEKQSCGFMNLFHHTHWPQREPPSIVPHTPGS